MPLLTPSFAMVEIENAFVAVYSDRYEYERSNDESNVMASLARCGLK